MPMQFMKLVGLGRIEVSYPSSKADKLSIFMETPHGGSKWAGRYFSIDDVARFCKRLKSRRGEFDSMIVSKDRKGGVILSMPFDDGHIFRIYLTKGERERLIVILKAQAKDMRRDND